jgi:glycosyltransferase involved in cell wall biosynthesis
LTGAPLDLHRLMNAAATPLVSVVMPVFNAAPYLREAIDSVLTQDYPALEMIVVDDGSTDGSTEILRSYGDRIRVLAQERRGPAAARNIGVRQARGDYIAFHDADDFWMPHKLTEQVALMREAPQFAIVFGQFAYWRADATGRFPDPLLALAHPETWEIKQPLSGYLYVDELLDSCIPMITPLIRREVFDALNGFDESLLSGSDYDFWLRATFRFQTHKMNRCQALYRIHEQGVTGTPRAVNFGYVLLKRAVDTFGLRGPDGRVADAALVRQRLATIRLNFAQLHAERGSLRVALPALLSYLQLSQWRPQAWIAAARAIRRALIDRFRQRQGR